MWLSDSELDNDPAGPRASGGDSGDDDNSDHLVDANDEFEGLTFHCDSPMASAVTKSRPVDNGERTKTLKARAANGKVPIIDD